MVELILKLYTMYMATDVRTPVPHLFGPPGCGKSSSVEMAAELLGVEAHTINVSRISPLELEGVQMPVSSEDEDLAQKLQLKLLHATYWTQLKDGDIVHFDELLRGFPEVYNGLLDIWTSRKVAGFELPKVFIIASSNTTVAYDKALEDRLLHLPVDDPRKNVGVKRGLAKRIVDQLGLLPEMTTSMEMESLLQAEVLPMYDVLDNLGKAGTSPVSIKGKSIRNLIGQALLREVQTPELQALITANNDTATKQAKHQYVFLTSGKAKHVPPGYRERALAIRGNAKLTPLQSRNLELNLQLIESEAIRQEKGTNVDDVDDFAEIFG